MRARTSNTIICLLGSILILGLAGLFLMGSSRAWRDSLKRELEGRLSGLLGREFAVAGVEFRLPLTLVVRDLEIAAGDSLSRGRLLSVPVIKLQASPWRTIRQGKLAVGQILLEGAVIHLKQDAEGRWNYQGLFKTDTTRTDKPSGSISLPPLAVSDITLSNLSFTAEMSGAKHQADSIDLQMSLEMGGPRLQAHLRKMRGRYRGGRLALSRAQGRLAIDGDSLSIQGLGLATQGSSLELTAGFDRRTGCFRLDRLEAGIELSEASSLLPAENKPWAGQVRISSRAEGKINSIRGCLKVSSRQAVVNGISLAGLDLRMEMRDSLVRMERLELNAGDGLVSGTGALNLADSSYRLEVELIRADAGAIMESGEGGLKTEINGRLSLNGRGFKPDLAWAKAELAIDRSLINQLPLDQLRSELRYLDKSLIIDQFSLASGQARLNVKGEIYPEALSVDVETEEIELSQFGPLLGIRDLEGKLRFTGLVSGTTRDPDVIGTFRLKEAVASNVSCLYLDGSMSLKQLATKPQGDGKFVATGLSIGRQSIDRVEMIAELRGMELGGVALHVVKDSITEAMATGLVEIDDGGIRLSLMKLFYNHGDQMVVNSQPVNLSLKGGDVELEPTKLILGRGSLELEGFYHKDRSIGLKALGDGIDSRRIVELVDLNKTVHGQLDFRLNLSGSLDRPELSSRFSLNNVRFEQFVADNLTIDLEYRDRQAELRRLAITRFGQLSEITLSVPLDLGVGPEAGRLLDKPMSGDIVLRDIGTWAFFPMAELLSVYEGRVDLNVRLSGTPFKPLMNGQMSIANAKMVLRPLGMYLHRVQAAAHFNADSLVIDNITAATENQGRVEIKRGEIILTQFLPTSMYFLIEVDRAPVRNIPFIEANVNARIEIGGKMDSPKITGQVFANSALITIPFAPAEPPPPPEKQAKPLDLNLSVTGSQGIWLRNADADIELKIDNLNVRMQQNLLFLSGRLETIQGVYRFLDRRFDITEGQLTFTNAVEINPELNLSAQTELNDENRTRVQLKVGGNALQPKLSFSSEPSMPEQDILTMLSVGMRLEPGANADLGEQALNRGTDYLSNMLAGIIQKKTGLVDVVKMKTYTGQEKGAEVTLGKYVTRNVFVSYTRGFAADLSNDFKAEYLFGPRSSLFVQSTSGDEQKEQKISLGMRMKFKY